MSDPIEEILEAKEQDLVMDAYIKKEVDKIKTQLIADLTKIFEGLLTEVEAEIMKKVENRIQEVLRNLPKPDAKPYKPFEPFKPSQPHTEPWKPWPYKRPTGPYWVSSQERYKTQITPVVSSSVDRITDVISRKRSHASKIS